MPDEHYVVVDGSNIATEGRSQPSLAQLDEAVRAFQQERPDAKLIVVVDATFGHRIDASERRTFEEGEAAGELVSPPAGAIGRGDKFLLQIADRVGAIVLSNDSFQEFHGEYEWLFEEGRLIGGKPVPGVGWIFTTRVPVRGPTSRVAVRAAKQAKKTDKVPDKKMTEAAAEAVAEATAEALAPKRSRRRRRGKEPSEAVNEPLAFISFIADHQPGSEVEAEVDSFTSHGAFVVADGARCYVPLTALAEPPPRSAKEVLTKGETRTFVVQAFDPPRRGIELALPGLARVAGAPTEETVEAEIGAGAERAPAKKKVAAKKKKAAPTKKEPEKKKKAAAPAKKAAKKKGATAKKKAAPSAKKAAPAKKAARKKA
jgi:Zc3h12a-like ribonuclease protein/S1 RNA binding family protein